MIRCAITDGTGSVAALEHALSTGIDLLQIREKQLSARELAAFVRAAVGSAKPYGTKVLVNDRADVAVACGAHGVHLRDGSVQPEVLRAVLPTGFLVTVSCHDPAGLQRAKGANYALVAPVFKPLSKLDDREPLGLAGLQSLVNVAPMPVLALGGITWENAAGCVEAGAAGVAGITLFGGQHPSVGLDSRR